MERPREKTENGPAKVAMCGSARLTLALEGMFGFCVLYMLRVHFSVAMVCMTAQPLSQLNNTYTEFDAFLFNETTQTQNEVCGGDTSLSNAANDKPGEFEWSKELRGIMLSAFFWGYIITQIPTGWLTSRFGSKMVIAGGMLLANVGNLFIPIAARTHPYLVVVLRFLMGFGHGVMFPGMHALWGRWAPPLERSALIASTYAGAMMGTVLAMSLAGFICTIDLDNGWPFIFYIYGVVSFVWWGLWLFLVYNTPSKHPRISGKERHYIEHSIGPSVYKRKFPIPWKSIMTSPPVWAIVVGHIANNWGNYTILTCIPTYMKEVHNVDIKANGVLVSLPYLVMYILTIFAGNLGDFLRQRNIFSTTTVRKIFQTIACGVPAIFIMATGFVDCERRYVSVVFLTIAVGATAFGKSGYCVNHVDIAPRFAGVLFGISNTAATIPGMVSPYIAAAITPNGTAAEWRIVFFICGIVYAVGMVVYLIFGSGEEQAWAKIESLQTKRQQVQLRSYEIKQPLRSATMAK